MNRWRRKLPEFPPDDPAKAPIPSNIRLPRKLWDRLDAIAKKERRSRNEVISFFLEWACDDYDLAQQRKKK